MRHLYPMLFEPNLHNIVWGGHRLKPLKGLVSDDEPIGESWEVSAVDSSASVVRNGSYAGLKLPDVVAERGIEVLGTALYNRYGGKFPLLIKFIDADKDLSIQVHPNDELARARHNKFGKTEMWYVLDAKPGAYLYSGFKQKVTKDEYRRRVADGTICEVLARHEVRPGDVFYIPSGRVHAICGGIFLAEVQQSSDVTYRIFDYNRPGLDGKPRELHTDLAADAIDYNVQDDYLTHYRTSLNRPEKVIDSPFFEVKSLRVSKPIHRKMFKYDTFVIYTCLSGGCIIRTRTNGDEVGLVEGESCLIPACEVDYDVRPGVQGAHLLEVYVDNRRPGLKSKLSKVRMLRRLWHMVKR